VAARGSLTRLIHTRHPVMPALAPELAVQAQTILLVEDDDAVRNVITRFLRRAGYAVLDFPDGESAVEMIRDYSGEIDLLLADTVLTGISGPDTARQALQMRPGLPVLFMSGYADQIVKEVIPEGLQDCFIAKPFRAQMLAHRIGVMLGNHPTENAE
jgi:DNA-binding response OmpR family regulator